MKKIEVLGKFMITVLIVVLMIVPFLSGMLYGFIKIGVMAGVEFVDMCTIPRRQGQRKTK